MVVTNIGRLMWEKRLFEMQGNDSAVKRLDKLIEKARKTDIKKEPKEDEEPIFKFTDVGM